MTISRLNRCAGLILSIVAAAVSLGAAQIASAATSTNAYGGRIETVAYDRCAHHVYYRVVAGDAYIKPWTWTGYQWKTTANMYAPNTWAEFDTAYVTDYVQVAVEFTKYYPSYGRITQYSNPDQILCNETLKELEAARARLRAAQGAQSANNLYYNAYNGSNGITSMQLATLGL